MSERRASSLSPSMSRTPLVRRTKARSNRLGEWRRETRHGRFRLFCGGNDRAISWCQVRGATAAPEMPDRSVDVHVHFDESNSRFLDQLLKLSLQAESHGVCAHALLLTGSGPRRGETASNANHPLRLRGPTRWLRMPIGRGKESAGILTPRRSSTKPQNSTSPGNDRYIIHPMKTV